MSTYVVPAGSSYDELRAAGYAERIDAIEAAAREIDATKHNLMASMDGDIWVIVEKRIDAIKWAMAEWGVGFTEVRALVQWCRWDPVYALRTALEEKADYCWSWPEKYPNGSPVFDSERFDAILKNLQADPLAFWDEDGNACPWRPAKRTDPDAVRFFHCTSVYS